MKLVRPVLFALIALLAIPASALPPKHAAPVAQTRWVGTWGAAPMSIANLNGQLFRADTTLRDIVHLSLGGPAIRLIFTNELGTGPLTLGAVSVAQTDANGAIQPGSAHPVLFDGKPGFTIPAGARAVSDPIDMPVAPLSDLTISYFLPGQPVAVVTQHSAALSTNYVAAGSQVDAVTMTGAQKLPNWRFLRGVDVAAGPEAAAVVTLGDSITDGAQSTPDSNSRWPDFLSRRLHADPKLSHLGVLNEGIGGNRILHDNFGPNALARFDRDVLAQDGVKFLIILEGINDIGRTAKPNAPGEAITADDLIAGDEQMIDRAHAHGIKVIGATLTPYAGAAYASPEGEQMRQALNHFIRTSGRFDGVIDFDKAIADPANPAAFNPAYNLRDHLHPNDAGYKVMGDAVDLSLFK